MLCNSFTYIGLTPLVKKYSTLASKNPELNPWYVTGFTDAESCFNIHFLKNSSNLIGWQVQARFIIEVNIKDIDSLYKIQSFLRV